jgi:hypothetical protein
MWLASFTVCYPDKQMHKIYIDINNILNIVNITIFKKYVNLYNIVNTYVVHLLVWIINYYNVICRIQLSKST